MEQIQKLKENNKHKNKLLLLLFFVLLAGIFLFYRYGMYFEKGEWKNMLQAVYPGSGKETENEEKTTPEKESQHTEAADFILDKFARANDQKRKANLRDIMNSLELYYSENGGYPLSVDSIKLSDENSPVVKEILKYTVKENLKDPKDPEFYYSYKSDGSGFELAARLENLNDAECETINKICVYKIQK